MPTTKSFEVEVPKKIISKSKDIKVFQGLQKSRLDLQRLHTKSSQLSWNVHRKVQRKGLRGFRIYGSIARDHQYITSAKGLGGWSKNGSFCWPSVLYDNIVGWWVRKGSKISWRNIWMVAKEKSRAQHRLDPSRGHKNYPLFEPTVYILGK